MSLAEIESKLLALPDEERRQFARWFYAHEPEILGAPDDEEEVEIDDDVKAELMRRRREIDEHPETLVTFDLGEFDRRMQELLDERAQRTPVRPR
jgi:hypothetical protein